MILEIIFFGAAIYLVSRSLLGAQVSRKPVTPQRHNPQVQKDMAYAERLYEDHKYLAAEKAYLGILKHEHKNIEAYDRLVKIYRALKNYPDAIECAQILAQLQPTAHNFFELGHVYFENKNYVKAIAAFEKSIMFEPSAGRYAALGKCFHRLSNNAKAVAAFEKAVELEPDKRNLQLLMEMYRLTHNLEKAKEIRARLAKLEPEKNPNENLASEAVETLKKVPA